MTGTGSGDRWAGYFDGDAKVTDDFFTGDDVRLQGDGWFGGGQIALYDEDGTRTVVIRGNETTSEGGEILLTEEAGNLTVQIDAQVENGGYFALYDEQIGDRIELQAKSSVDAGAFMNMYSSDEIRTISLDTEEFDGQGAAVYLYNGTGAKTIELDADLNGKGRVITGELEITGGSDLAEYFDVSMHSAQARPGTVVSIDPENIGSLKVCSEANDRKVAGIISGANGIDTGMLMGQKNSIAFGNYPVAIAGRVYALADESNGKIKPGDLLTTSDRAGYATKVTDYDRSMGAILGKAMSGIDENGFVLVLITLQ